MWAGLINNLLIGPIFLELLRDELPPLLEEVPEEIRNRIFLQMDGCPAYYERMFAVF